MLKQFEQFVLKSDINEVITKGMTGIVLDIYPEQEAIEAEFVQSDGSNFTYQGQSTFAIRIDQIEPIKS